MRKSITFAIKSPYANVDLYIVNERFLRSPTSCSASPISGFMRSVTKAVMSFDDAAPITNAIARPITPNVCRKPMNS